ncbi:MAG TPA: metallophosphoesterase [Hadesarchaea archaeon]|nr:metallophosphoesterase [Hadesarchaea archaeon]
MRIGLIADVHSNLQAFRAVLEDMPKLDRIICAGDLVGYATEPNEVVNLAKSKRLLAVMGNHDYAALTRDVRGFNPIAAEAAVWTADKLTPENVKFLSNLPDRLELKLGGYRIYVVHGSPRNPLGEYVFPEIPNHELARIVQDLDADVIVLGHTHVPMKRMILGKLVINPGGVGQPRDRDPRASYAILTIGKKIEVDHRRVEYDPRKTAEKIKAAGLPEELAARLFFGW